MTQKTSKGTREYEQLKKKVSTYYADDVFKNALMASEEPVGSVSLEGFHFDTLFAYPGMKEYFAENGMITSGESDRFALCQEAVDLARGEQGEMAGKFILRKELGMICNDITDGVRYERFDVELNSDVYIDFKNYTNGELSPKRMRELIEKTQEKAVKINAKKVYIVNLIADETGTVQAYDDNTEKSVQVVYINGLLDKQGCIIRPHLSQFLKEDYVNDTENK